MAKNLRIHREKRLGSPGEMKRRVLLPERDKEQCLTSGSILNMRQWPDTPQPSSNLINTNTPL